MRNDYREVVKVTQRVEAKHKVNPDLLSPVLFSFGYTSMAQLSVGNNTFQDDLKWLPGFPILWTLWSFEGTSPPWMWQKDCGKAPRVVDGWGELPWGHVDVLEEAAEPVQQGHTQGTRDGDHVALHVLQWKPLGIALAATVISAWFNDVRDEIIISSIYLEKGNKEVSQNYKLLITIPSLSFKEFIWCQK